MGEEANRVESARERRRALKDAMAELQAVVAAPAGMSGWLDRVTRALESLSEALDRHVDMVEGDDGLLAEIGEMAPHLQSEIEQMHTDHNELHAKMDTAKLVVGEAARGPDGPVAVRREMRSLISSLEEHRERGADLVYDAYNIDITAAD